MHIIVQNWLMQSDRRLVCYTLLLPLSGVKTNYNEDIRPFKYVSRSRTPYSSFHCISCDPPFLALVLIPTPNSLFPPVFRTFASAVFPAPLAFERNARRKHLYTNTAHHETPFVCSSLFRIVRYPSAGINSVLFPILAQARTHQSSFISLSPSPASGRTDHVFRCANAPRLQSRMCTAVR